MQPSSSAPSERPSPSAGACGGATAADLPWWNDRVFYEVFVRSFADCDGDGIGDLQGLTAKLDYLNDGDPATTDDLGVAGLWLMPVSESPSYHGYDVTDYEAIEHDYGTIADFEQLLAGGAPARASRSSSTSSSTTPSATTRGSWTSTTPGSAHDDWYVWSDTQPP